MISDGEPAKKTGVEQRKDNVIGKNTGRPRGIV